MGGKCPAVVPRPPSLDVKVEQALYMYYLSVGVTWLSEETNVFRSAGLKDGHYIWTEDLVAFQKPKEHRAVSVTSIREAQVQSPLCVRQDKWKRELEGHPDRSFVGYILDGLQNGFRTGFKEESGVPFISPSNSNLPSAREHPEVVEAYLGKECKAGRVLGPLDVGPLKGVKGIQVSPIGVIPKKTPGKWRLIVDLSSPRGRSINDGIEEKQASLAYVSMDNVTETITALGQGTYMGKCDVKEAYRLIPVHTEERQLLGMYWEGRLFVDLTLPFGLRSAPKVFTAVADAFQWVVGRRGVDFCFHYVDDFLVLGRTHGECEDALRTIDQAAEELGFSMEPSKREGPSTTLIFLGIEVDSQLMELRLPQDKLGDLKCLLAQWLGRKHTTKRDLESLTGKLQHACRVVRPGRSFLRRLYALISVGNHPSSLLRLNREIQSDLWWWYTWVEEWNGVSLLWKAQKAQPDEHIWSDAAGSWGCGAVWGPLWFQLKWAESLKVGLEEGDSIAVREMIPAVVAAAVWGSHWRGKVVMFHSDNKAVVSALNRTYSRCEPMMHLVRCLVFYAARFAFWFTAVHVPGVDNILADHLSRNRLTSFFASYPQASSLTQTTVPDCVKETIAGENPPDWRSENWTRQFKNSSGRP